MFAYNVGYFCSLLIWFCLLSLLLLLFLAGRGFVDIKAYHFNENVLFFSFSLLFSKVANDEVQIKESRK